MSVSIFSGARVKRQVKPDRSRGQAARAVADHAPWRADAYRAGENGERPGHEAARAEPRRASRGQDRPADDRERAATRGATAESAVRQPGERRHPRHIVLQNHTWYDFLAGRDT